MSQLLRGVPFYVDGFAINDFESITIGTVSDLTIGATLNGGVTLGPTYIFTR